MVGQLPARVKRTRRRWTIEERRSIVEAARTSGDPVSVVARRHGMNANHLFNWLRRDRDGTLDRGALTVEPGGPMDFVALGVVGEGPPRDMPAERVEIELPDGSRVRVALRADPDALQDLLRAVRGSGR